MKLLIIMSVVGVALAGTLGVFSGSPNKQTSSFAKAPELNEAPGGKASPFFIEQNDQANKERVGQAMQSGGSAMPTPVGNDVGALTKKDKDPLLEFQAETERLKQEFLTEQQQRDKQIQVLSQQIQTQKATPEDDSLAKAMQKQMQTMMESWTPHGIKVVSGVESAPTSATGAASQRGTASGEETLVAANASTTKITKPLIPSGTVNYIQLLTEANSDVPGPILAQILSGPLSGGRAIGKFTVSNDYLILSFTHVSFKGKEFPINALALDPDTTLGGLATEVDHRYFLRVVLPAAGAFVSAFGSVMSESSTSTTTTDGVVVQDQAKRGLKEGLYAGAGQAGQTVAQFFQNEANKTMTLVRVAVGTPMGLFFLDPLYKAENKADPTTKTTTKTKTQEGTAGGGSVPYPKSGAYNPMSGLSAAQRATLNSYRR